MNLRSLKRGIKFFLLFFKILTFALTIASHVVKNYLKIIAKICGALRDLVPFVQFKKREKHPWKSVNFSKIAGFEPATLLKLTFLHGCFSGFLNCTNGTKLRNAPHIRS